ncbi:unnamed protein product [Rotaria sp. Silwood2]|nr:unnamed protein product [Rotaria sp. Silwood2]CAF3105039.1 unnamed protein product [Rotaria sp. Silwood2]CAF3338086.1 unnamed protein product [Rotaria sp. Silwood2]CAF4328662.1 unnamed protein product [Rotaria sp. Silwood2]CAF4392228.1 unnamed protein product [Rotaria sp. Silwood2]
MSRISVDLIQIVYLIVFLFTVVCEAEHSVPASDKQIKIASLNGSITNVQGILVGHASKSERPTGCTVILCNTSCIGGVDVRGSAPGTRETDLLDPMNLVDTVNAIVLSGGSAFGLDTASGVVRCLAEKNMGFPTSDRPVPIVPAAVLYDLSVGNDSSIVPDANLGYSACMAANNSPVVEGNAGAGSGATIGKLFGMERAMKTGLGSTSMTVRDSITNATVTVGALVAVNAVGDVYKRGTLIAGARTLDGKRLQNTLNTLLDINPNIASSFLAATATTLACVATDAKLTKAQAKKVSQMAHDGFARAINPIHTMFDGDVIFTLATGVSPISDVNLVGIMAAETVERAIIRAVEQATGLPGLPSIHELNSTGDKLVCNIATLVLILFLKCL